jgi:hypothetical protein
MLDGFRATTQFIVVTHNKGTMSACQALYGVTMQVKGVSRFVAVELGDVDELAPGTTGKARDVARHAADDAVDGEEEGEPRGPFARERPPARGRPVEEDHAVERDSAIERDRESGEPVKTIVPARSVAQQHEPVIGE